MRSKIGKAAAALLAGCTLLAGCGSGGDGGDEAQKDTGGAVQVRVATDSTKSTVFVQMTGLLLIVPPTTGNELKVYLPRNVGGHAARLGFAVPQGVTLPTNFCDNGGTAAHPDTICYVNLKHWTLAPVGAGGSPATTTLAGMPPVSTSGLLSLTEISGGDYRVFPTHAGKKSHPPVTFLSGQLVDSLACKLAEWTYTPVDQQGMPQPAQTHRLANVLVWEMMALDTPSLVFERQGQSAVRVPLPPGETWLLLAHIPAGELRHLPPGEADSVISSTHADLHPLYDVLGRSNSEADSLQRGSMHRRIPGLVAGDTVPCRVVLSSMGQKSRDKDGIKSMATYACMPGSGSGG